AELERDPWKSISGLLSRLPAGDAIAHQPARPGLDTLCQRMHCPECRAHPVDSLHRELLDLDRSEDMVRGAESCSCEEGLGRGSVDDNPVKQETAIVITCLSDGQHVVAERKLSANARSAAFSQMQEIRLSWNE